MELRICTDIAWPASVGEALTGALSAPGRARICLPTGRTARPAYAWVARRCNESALDLTGATVILLDEFLDLEPEDPARCDVQLRTDLFDRLVSPPAFVTCPVDEFPPETAAALLAEQAQGLDLAVLGLGLNGHIGMNEPGSDPESATRVVELAPSTRENAVTSYGAARIPQRGITLGLRTLLGASEVWLLVTGSEKAEILARTLEGPIGPEVPASLLRLHRRLTVFADASAARLLDTEKL